MKTAIDTSKATSWFVVRTNIKCEAKAEENIRQAGFATYYPRYRVELKNKRTHTYRTVERPLLMRYLFVGLPRLNAPFGFVRNCDGVECLLGINGTPIAVNGKDVETLYIAEIDMRFDDTRAARIHRKEEAATRKQTLEMKYTKGRQVTITDGPFATFSGLVEEVAKNGNIKVLMKLFGSMVPAEFEAGHLSTAA